MFIESLAELGKIVDHNIRTVRITPQEVLMIASAG
jgi:hypothetical protein